MQRLEDLAVARLMQVQSTQAPAPIGGYEPGKFYKVATNPVFGGRTVRVGALVYRANGVAVAKPNMLLCIGDRICTGPATLVMLEFLIGGRVSINANAEAIIETDRSVADSKSPGFFKAMQQAKQLKQPLEILPTGLIFAVRG